MMANTEDRRNTKKDISDFWDCLSIAQKFSVAELQRFGYDLAFVRSQESNSLAVMRSGERLVSI